MWNQKDTFKHGLCQGLYSKYLSTGMLGTWSPQVGKVPTQGSGDHSSARIYPFGCWITRRRGTWQTGLETPLMPRFILLIARLWGRKWGAWYIGFRGLPRVLEELTSTGAFLYSPSEVTLSASNQYANKYKILLTSRVILVHTWWILALMTPISFAPLVV